ncbi:hypothetical protein CAL14_20135 [Bordetella genomosp. 9]|nr:hypothetical protein CAL14_20135 [Bordetella genomosp. 9]
MLKGATLADRRSRIRGVPDRGALVFMGGGGATPEALARFPLEGATLADRRSRIRGVPDRGALVFMGGGGSIPEALALHWQGVTPVGWLA